MDLFLILFCVIMTIAIMLDLFLTLNASIKKEKSEKARKLKIEVSNLSDEARKLKIEVFKLKQIIEKKDEQIKAFESKFNKKFKKSSEMTRREDVKLIFKGLQH